MRIALFCASFFVLSACASSNAGPGTETYAVMAAAQSTADTGTRDTGSGPATITIDSSSFVVRAMGVACSFTSRRDGDVVTLTPAQECVATPRSATLRLTLQSGQARIQGMGVTVMVMGRYARVDNSEVGTWSLTASGLRGG